jgi:hypothetical protein
LDAEVFNLHILVSTKKILVDAINQKKEVELQEMQYSMEYEMMKKELERVNILFIDLINNIDNIK